MKTRVGSLLLAVLVSEALAAQQAQPRYQQDTQPKAQKTQPKATPRYQEGGQPAPTSGKYSAPPQLTGADRDTVRTCMAGTYGPLPPGTRLRPLPPALEEQIQLNAPLPAALRNRVRPLPEMCASRLLAPLPANWTRVLLGRHVLLLDPNQRVSDMFDLD